MAEVKKATKKKIKIKEGLVLGPGLEKEINTVLDQSLPDLKTKNMTMKRVEEDEKKFEIEIK
jgi:hypothetical protein